MGCCSSSTAVRVVATECRSHKAEEQDGIIIIVIIIIVIIIIFIIIISVIIIIFVLVQTILRMHEREEKMKERLMDLRLKSEEQVVDVKIYEFGDQHDVCLKVMT